MARSPFLTMWSRVFRNRIATGGPERGEPSGGNIPPGRPRPSRPDNHRQGSIAALAASLASAAVGTLVQQATVVVVVPCAKGELLRPQDAEGNDPGDQNDQQPVQDFVRLHFESF